MRWLLLLIAILGLFGSWWVSSPLWFGLGLFVGIVASLAAAFAFAHARIESSSQVEFISDPEIEALKSAVRQNKNKHSGSVPSVER